MKFKHVVLTVFVVLFLDQFLKIYIKTHFFYGQEVNVIGHWFRLHFIENEGMAFGMKFGGEWGKILLTVFRIVAVIWGFYFIKYTLIKEQYANGLIFCSALILAGALGNSFDSVFYGKIFTESSFHVARMVDWGQGYGDLLHGRVVDMLYFPIFSGHFPSSSPLWPNESFEFFRPVFNIADASISGGVIAIFVFQRKLLRKKNLHQPEAVNDETDSVTTEEANSLST